MESVKKAKERFRQYPLLLAKCKAEATDYAKCVLKKDNVKLSDCGEEFARFKGCLRKSAAALKTRL